MKRASRNSLAIPLLTKPLLGSNSSSQPIQSGSSTRHKSKPVLRESSFTGSRDAHCSSLPNRAGFRAEALNCNTWRGKSWGLTNHNLDRIYTRDGLAYGAEIKNTQNYISRNELRTKLQLAQHLEVIPLFIMRFAPKSYIYEIVQAGGFALLFEEQMYPWGHSELLRQVRHELGLKVGSPRDVKEGDIQRLEKWHQKRRALSRTL